MPTSYYRKYRPGTVSELDLQKVRELFQAVLKSGSLSHAYLFSGPKGVGKTSTARILAKVVNCEKNVDRLETGKSLADACNTCASCLKIAAGTSLAVLEMDAASNRGIDDIRALRDRIALSPTEGKRTIYIIDEVHMLTTEAFNALLKTLEEPPAHALFVLCTTEGGKLPTTIVSRCIEVSFYKASIEEVKASLEKVVAGEHLTVDEESLQLIAQAADGSFRDGMKYLEQVALLGKKIDRGLVEGAIGIGHNQTVGDFWDALVSKDGKKALSLLGALEESGSDVSLFAKSVVEYGRGQLMRVWGEGGEAIQLAKLLERLNTATVAIKTASLAALPLEIMAMEWCVEGPVTVVADTPVRSAPAAAEARALVGRQDDTPALKSSVGVSSKEEKGVKKPALPGKMAQVELVQLVERWREVLTAVRPFNHSLEALLRASKPVACDQGVARVEVFYQFHKEQLEQQRYRRVVEDVLSQLFGGTLRLEFVLGKGQTPLRTETQPNEANVSGAVADETLAQAAEQIFGDLPNS